MTAIRYIDAPSRRPGETGAAFIERMLAELEHKGGAKALPTPPKIVIQADKAKSYDAPRVVPDARRDPPPSRGDRDPGASEVGGLEPDPWRTEIKRPIEIPEVYGPLPKPLELVEPFGPVYPALPGANKWRKLARMRELTRDEKREYGQTVLDGINAMNAKLLDRDVAPFRSNSASGTFHNNGKDILAAINAQNRAAATRY